MLSDPVLNQYKTACNGTTVLPFSERILLAERIIYVIVACLLAWFVFEVRALLFSHRHFWRANVSTVVCWFVGRITQQVVGDF